MISTTMLNAMSVIVKPNILPPTITRFSKKIFLKIWIYDFLICKFQNNYDMHLSKSIVKSFQAHNVYNCH